MPYSLCMLMVPIFLQSRAHLPCRPRWPSAFEAWTLQAVKQLTEVRQTRLYTRKSGVAAAFTTSIDPLLLVPSNFFAQPTLGRCAFPTITSVMTELSPTEAEAPASGVYDASRRN